MYPSKKILIIDDDVDDQDYFRDAVTEINPAMKCEVANNGIEALVQIKTPPPFDYIFLDLNMPKMNGFECLISLRKQEHYKNVPVVIFTTSKNSHDIDRAKELGANLFFTKPTSFAILCNKLKQIFELGFSAASFVI